jgi:hypothetical protein
MSLLEGWILTCEVGGAPSWLFRWEFFEEKLDKKYQITIPILQPYLKKIKGGWPKTGYTFGTAQ